MIQSNPGSRLSDPVQSWTLKLSSLTTKRPQNWKNYGKKIKDENNALTERVNNLAYILSDLNNKAKIAEDEKASLICALRILQDDVNHQAEQRSINKNSRSGKKKDGARSTKTSAHDEYESGNPLGVNKFNPLVIEDAVINDELDGKETSQDAKGKPKEKKEKNQKKLKKSRESNELKNRNAPDPNTTDNDESTSQNNNTIIVGDSMLKMLNAGRMRRSVGQNVVIKTFPGAKTSDMKHYACTAGLTDETETYGYTCRHQ